VGRPTGFETLSGHFSYEDIMVKHIASAVVVSCLLAQPAFAQDAKTVLANASKAIAADGVHALTVYGSGTQFGAPAGSSATSTPISDFRQSFDFAQPATRATANQGAVNFAVTAADRAWTAQYDIWTTPWGFLRGAAANNATVSTRTIGREKVHVVSWTAPFNSPAGQAYRVVGYISATTNMVDAVETWVDTPGVSTIHLKRFYGSWKDASNGVKFPGTVIEHRSGRAAFDMRLARVDVNPANVQEFLATPAPSNARGAGRGAPAPGGAPAPAQTRPTGINE
jgi:hypothetical protein